MDGTLLGMKDLGVQNAGWFFDPDSEWGAASSPVIYGHMVIVQCDRQKDSFIAAFDLKDGNELWRTARAEIPTVTLSPRDPIPMQHPKMHELYQPQNPSPVVPNVRDLPLRA